MVWPAVLIVVYCVFVVAASLAGGWLPALVRVTHTRMQLMMSLVSGLMLGVALLHMLPHAYSHYPHMGWVTGSMLAGLLLMFFLLRIFHLHSHEPADDGPHDHDHDHEAAHDDLGKCGHSHRMSWVGLAFGLAIHTLLDGVALGASVVADAGHMTGIALLGFGTFLAVVLHKPLDALSITAVMNAGGWSARAQAAVNVGYALMCPLGAILFWFGASQLNDQNTNMFVGCALAFSAGVFLCIALGDLLPEVRFHRHDRIKLSMALLLGVAVAFGIELLPGHSHKSHDHEAGDAGQPHDDQHDHD